MIAHANVPRNLILAILADWALSYNRELLLLSMGLLKHSDAD